MQLILIYSTLIFFNISFFQLRGELNIYSGKTKTSFFVFSFKMYEVNKDTFFSKEFIKYFNRNQEENWIPISMNDYKVNIFNSRHYDSKFGILAFYCNMLEIIYKITKEENEKKTLLLNFYELMKTKNIEGIKLLFKEKSTEYLKEISTY